MTVASEFYEALNEFNREAVSTEEDRMLSALEVRLTKKRTLLPASFGGKLRWYGFASSNREVGVLREELNAWVGLPLSEGCLVVQEPEDQFDTEVLRLFPKQLVVRIKINEGWEENSWESISRLMRLWEIAPERSTDLLRPVGRILRQFYDGINAQDQEVAEEALVEIRDRKLLAPLNCHYLKVKLLAEFEQYELLHSHIEGALSPDLRFPAAVISCIARAVDALHITPDSSGKINYQEVARTVKEEWGFSPRLDQTESIFTARWLAVIEGNASEPRSKVIEELRKIWGHDSVVNEALKPFEATGVEEAPQTLKTLYENDEFVGLLESLRGATPNPENATYAFAAAVGLGVVNAAQQALDLFAELSEGEKKQVLELATQRRQHQQLLKTCENLGETEQNAIPTDWLEWTAGDWPDRPDLLEEWAKGWESPDSLDKTAVSALQEALLNAFVDPDKSVRVRNGVPLLVSWALGESGNLSEELVPLCVYVVELLLDQEDGVRTVDRVQAERLLAAILESGSVTSSEYSGLLVSIQSQFANLSANSAFWLASVLEHFLIYDTHDPKERTAMINMASSAALRWVELLNPFDAELLTRIFRINGTELDLLQDEVINSKVLNENRPFSRVGIYSLHEAATAQVVNWINEKWPEVRVETSSAHGAEERLTAMVKGVDVMLVHTSRAKHAATDSIKVAMIPGEESKIVRVAARGASSLWRELNKWVEQPE